MIAILVDADACPVKDEVYAVATRYDVPVAVVANAPMSVPRGSGAQLVVVGRDLDAADDWIAAHAQPGDVVVTADVPLAARCLAAGARVLRPDGRIFDDAMIGDALATRQLMSDLREQGSVSGGPKPLADKDRARFASRLDQMVQLSLRETTPQP
ncbi:MAG: YaiI/YqxD family protein [Proteobacteria bacterium]|nr:MAG: YaiI/YqxD family protein [Pseudomonadota bacterium]